MIATEAAVESTKHRSEWGMKFMTLYEMRELELKETAIKIGKSVDEVNQVIAELDDCVVDNKQKLMRHVKML